ncbi:hypothetical protein GCM10009716_35710 [Streptomyces sodiiphilus]|uniref:ABC transporter substrate-binding protein n=1 Tax=Streptomyces sodiiphilus TaxID=226217 RepID=A0ABN2PKJ4_9ACTN
MRAARARGAVLAALAVPALLAASCSGGPEADAFPADDGRPLVVVSSADLTTRDGRSVRRELIDAWNAIEGNREARLVELPSGADTARSQLVASLQSGTADFDLLNLDIVWIPEFAEAGLIAELDEELLEPDFLPQAARAGRWRGAVYAVPFNTDVGLLYYRTDLLGELDRGPERLREETLGELLGNWPRGARHPLYITQLASYEGLTVNAMEALWSSGAELVDEDGRYVGSREELEAGLRELERITGAEINPLADEADETLSLREFSDEDSGTVLMRNWPYAATQLDAALPPDVGFGITTLPGAAALGGQSLAVAADSVRARDAEKLIEFLTHPGTDSQRSLLRAGFAPALRDAYRLEGSGGPDCHRSRFFARPEPPSGDRRELPPGAPSGSAPVYGAVGYAELLWCALQEARPRPATPHYPEFSRLLRTEVKRMLDDKGWTPRSAAEALHEALPGVLGGEPVRPAESP